MTLPDKHADTQQRLLESACELFAEKGYAGTTVAEICDHAEANNAAVNYYFRSKENLYVEAWRLSFRRSLEAHPLEAGVSPDAPPEERFRSHVLATVRRITDPNSHEFDIVEKERVAPTGLLAEIMRESIEPVRRRMDSIISELLGEGATERHIALCRKSVMSQCMHIFLRERAGRAFGPPPIALSVDEVAEHIVRFSLAGIRRMRGEIDAGGSPGQVRMKGEA